MAAAWRRLAFAVIATAAIGITIPASAAPGNTITLQDATLSAAAGLATDVDRDVYWMARPPDGGVGTVTAVNPDGSIAGEVRYEASPSGVAGLSLLDGQLYVGDVDGSGRSRASVDVYRLDSLEYGTTTSYTKWTLHYPDGPHDALTMMVSPRGNIWIVTKANPGGLYYAQAPEAAGDVQLVREGDAPAWVTDGTFVSGTAAVLRTYTGVIAFDMMQYTVTAQEPAPEQPQGESITVTLDGQGLLLGSKLDPRLLEVAVPTTMQQLPAAPSAPPGPTAQPDPSPETPDAPAAPDGSETPKAPVAPNDQPERAGPIFSKTQAALGIAAIVSVGAGLLVYWRTRPQTR